MKTNELPLRDRIVAHLKNTGEATAAAIAKAVGMADTPSRVTKELNAMRTDALIEAERKGKGPDLTYWLAVAQAPLPQAALPDNIRAGTRAAQIWQALPEHGQRPMLAREIVAATGVAKEIIAPALTGMVKAGQVCRIDDGLEYAYARMPTASQPAEIPLDEQKQGVVPAEAVKESLMTAEAAKEVATVRESVMVPEATDERTEALDQIRALLADRVSGNIDPSDLSEVELADRAADMIDNAVDEISELQQRAQAQDQALQQQTALVAELRRVFQVSKELLTDKDAELQQQAGLIVELRRQVAEHASALAIMDEQVMAARAVLAPLVPGKPDDGSATLKEVAERISAGLAEMVAQLVDKGDRLHKQAAVIAELRDRHDATLAAHAEEVVELRTRLDAAPIARGDSPLNPADEDPSVDILQVAKAWHVVAKGYTIASAASIKVADRIARRMVLSEGETAVVGAWVPMFKYGRGVKVRSAR